jgi:uracil-DNA glycosylase family 4
VGGDHLNELADLIAATRAHLEVEQELGNDGLAVRRALASAAPPAQVAAAAAVPSTPAVTSSATASAAAAERAQAPTGGDKHVRLAQLASEAATCTRCVLHEKRTQSVFARGTPDAQLVFVGEGPGYEEDQQGLPFVGPAGKLLDRMITAMGFGRDEVYVCNIVKCRPPENRTPRPEEAIACSRYLVPQLELVAPKVIVALGRCAAENLGVAQATGSWRGRWGTWRDIAVLPTYHPAYLLRSPEQKRVVWEDLQLVMARFGRTPTPRSRSDS